MWEGISYHLLNRRSWRSFWRWLDEDRGGDVEGEWETWIIDCSLKMYN
jgi:hypothetical protein